MTTRRIATTLIAFLLLCGTAMAGGERVCPEDVAIYDPAEGISEPQVVHKVSPQYPEEARKEGATGSVVLDAIIDTEGQVVEVGVLEDPDQRLTEAAVGAVRQWRFEPATTADGTPVKVCFILTVKFSLEK
jgi:TonB family protein